MASSPIPASDPFKPPLEFFSLSLCMLTKKRDNQNSLLKLALPAKLSCIYLGNIQVSVFRKKPKFLLLNQPMKVYGRLCGQSLFFFAKGI